MAVVTPLNNQRHQAVARRDRTRAQPRAVVANTAGLSDLLQAGLREELNQAETRLQADLREEVQADEQRLQQRFDMQVEGLKLELSALIDELGGDSEVQSSPWFGLWGALATGLASGFVLSSMIGMRLTMRQK